MNNAVDDGNNLCKLLEGKRLFSALYGIHKGVLRDLKFVSEASAIKRPATKVDNDRNSKDTDEGFCEQRRRNRNNSAEDGDSVRNKQPATATPVRVNCKPHECQQGTASMY